MCLLVLGFYWGLSSEAATPLVGPIPQMPESLGCSGNEVGGTTAKKLLWGKPSIHISPHLVWTGPQSRQGSDQDPESGHPQSWAIKALLSEHRDNRLFGSSGCWKFTGTSAGCQMQKHQLFRQVNVAHHRAWGNVVNGLDAYMGVCMFPYLCFISMHESHLLQETRKTGKKSWGVDMW